MTISGTHLSNTLQRNWETFRVKDALRMEQVNLIMDASNGSTSSITFNRRD